MITIDISKALEVLAKLAPGLVGTSLGIGWGYVGDRLGLPHVFELNKKTDLPDFFAEQ